MGSVKPEIQLEGFRQFCLYVYDTERKLHQKTPKEAMQETKARVQATCLPKMKQHIPSALKWAKDQFGD